VEMVVPKITQENKQSEKAIDTSAWKLYQNTAYGYEMKYPNTWEIGTTFGADPNTFSAPDFSLPNCSSNGTGICPSFAIGNVHEIKEGESIKSDINFDKDDRLIVEKNIKISGEDASLIEYYQDGYGRKDGTKGLVRQEIKVIHNGTMYRFYIHEYNTDINKIKTSADWDYGKTFEAMLASFKFVENTVVVNPMPTKNGENSSF